MEHPLDSTHAFPQVRVVPVGERLVENERLLDGTRPVIMQRIQMLAQVEHLPVA